MNGVLTELKRRRVVRAAFGYGVVCFGLLQVIEPVMHALHLPDAVLTYAVLLLAAGFPVVLVLAWALEGGAKHDAPRAPAPRWMIPALIGAGLLLAVPGIGWAVLHARHAADAPAPSIAVLPFADLSPQHDQDFFSDGVSEEILNALAQIDGLKVIGRTSSFSFKGKNEDLRAIGERLSVANLLEGSVRKDGQRVRITAQLIEAAGGTHLWSQTFDRQLVDVLAVQAEIAHAVADALRLKLLPGATTGIAIDPEAHRQLLICRQFVRRGSQTLLAQAEAACAQAVQLAPNWGAAWAELSNAIYDAELRATNQPVARAAIVKRAKDAADSAIRLAPADPAGYIARAQVRAWGEFDFAGGRQDGDRAIELAPSNNDALRQRAWLAFREGRFSEAVADGERAAQIDPLDADGMADLGLFLLGAGRIDAAESAILRAREVAPDNSRAAARLGVVRLLQQRPQEALREFEGSSFELWRIVGRGVAGWSLGDRKMSDDALKELLTDRWMPDAAYQAVQVYAWRGHNDEAFAWIEKAFAVKDLGLSSLKGDPLLVNLRKDPRWAPTLAKFGWPAD